MKQSFLDAFPYDLTWITDSRPENLTLRLKLFVESEFEVEYTQILLLNPNSSKKHSHKTVLFCFVPVFWT